MFLGLIARAEALAAERAARRRSRIAADAAAGAPAGVSVEEGGDGVVLAGPGLARRWLRDSRLRAFVETLR
jgi:hypothetical protein